MGKRDEWKVGQEVHGLLTDSGEFLICEGPPTQTGPTAPKVVITKIDHAARTIYLSSPLTTEKSR